MAPLPTRELGADSALPPGLQPLARETKMKTEEHGARERIRDHLARRWARVGARGAVLARDMVRPGRDC